MNSRTVGFVCAAAAALISPQCIQAQRVTGYVGTGGRPEAVAINPATNRIYVANFTGDTVTVIDGATGATNSVPAGSGPCAIAVNPATNKIYVANTYYDQDLPTPHSPTGVTANTVTVIDGAANTTTTVVVGSLSQVAGIAVNPVTNKIYVSNYSDNAVIVIDGFNNATTAITVTGGPGPIAINPVTNRIYVGTGSAVAEIDGSTNQVTTIAGAGGLKAIAVNPVTNKIYSVGYSVTAIDGATRAVAILPWGDEYGWYPQAIAVNPVTNKIYTANTGCQGFASATEIDGATNAVSVIHQPPGFGFGTPSAIAVDSSRNRLYVTGWGSGTVTWIDVASRTMTTTNIGAGPSAVAVNPVTNKVYAASAGADHVAVIDGSVSSTATVAVQQSPGAVAVNPVTGKIYVANQKSNSVTVIDGTTNATETIGVGSLPIGIVVNPNTNRIYTLNLGYTVSVIDGATKAVTTFSLHANGGCAIALNPLKNRIYVANTGTNNVSVIDGATNAITLVAIGGIPCDLAVNPALNKVYVANLTGRSVTVIDGDTNATSVVRLGSYPNAIAVNPTTNLVYAASVLGGVVTVINGVTNATSVIAVGSNPKAIAVNPVTNKIYVTTYNDRAVTVIDGATKATSVVGVGMSPWPIAVNAASNRIYVGSSEAAGGVTVINGADNTTTTIAAGSSPKSVAVNPVTGKVYVANEATNNVTVFTEEHQTTTSPLQVSITAKPKHAWDTALTFDLQPTSTFSPTAPTPQSIYYQVDSCQGAWTRATKSDPTFTGSPWSAILTLPAGPHVLYAYAEDGQAATSTQLDSPFTGGIAAYPFLMPATTALMGGTPDARLANGSVLAAVAAGDTLVSGFAIAGEQPKSVLVRAVGPTLAQFGVAGALASPQLALCDSASCVLGRNSAWGGSDALRTAHAAVGAFALPTNSMDCVLASNLTPGVYTARVNGTGGTGGVVLAEVYDADKKPADNPDPDVDVVPISRLVNISGRANVEPTGPGCILGLVVAGTSTETVLLRGVGPTLSQYGIAAPLAGPQLTLYDCQGNIIAMNAGWGNGPTLGTSPVSVVLQAATAETMSNVGAFALPEGSADCAMLVGLPPGAYTVQLTSTDGSHGTALVEAYEAH